MHPTAPDHVCGRCTRRIIDLMDNTVYSITSNKIYHARCAKYVYTTPEEQKKSIMPQRRCIIANCTNTTSKPDWICAHCITHLEKGIYRNILDNTIHGLPLEDLGHSIVTMHSIPHWLRDMDPLTQKIHSIYQWLHTRILQHLQSSWQYTFTPTKIYTTAYRIVADIMNASPTTFSTDTNFNTLTTVRAKCKKGVPLSDIIVHFKDFCSDILPKKNKFIHCISRTTFRAKTIYNIQDKKRLLRNVISFGVRGCDAATLYAEYEDAIYDVHALIQQKKCILTPDGRTLLYRCRPEDPIPGLRAAWKPPAS